MLAGSRVRKMPQAYNNFISVADTVVWVKVLFIKAAVPRTGPPSATQIVEKVPCAPPEHAHVLNCKLFHFFSHRHLLTMGGR